MTETHEVVVMEDLEYIAQAERIHEEGPKTIQLKPSDANPKEIFIQKKTDIQKETNKPLKSSKSFLSGALKIKNVKIPFQKPKK